jgi:DNA adenine methylase
LRYIPNNVSRVVSPFIGGGSVEVSLAVLGKRVFGYDLFEPLVNFWIHVLNDAKGLANIANSYRPVIKEKFYQLKSKDTFTSNLERAAVYFTLNRTSFAGATYSGGFSPDTRKFSDGVLKRLENFSCKNLSVRREDFRDVFMIQEHQDDFMYLDPPYLISASNLYGKNGDLHKEFDHVALFNLLSKRDNWVMSYNNGKEVRDMYKGYRQVTLDWSYGKNYGKKIEIVEPKELLILSNDLPEII